MLTNFNFLTNHINGKLKKILLFKIPLRPKRVLKYCRLSNMYHKVTLILKLTTVFHKLV